MISVGLLAVTVFRGVPPAHPPAARMSAHSCSHLVTAGVLSTVARDPERSGTRMSCSFVSVSLLSELYGGDSETAFGACLRSGTCRAAVVPIAASQDAPRRP